MKQSGGHVKIYSEPGEGTTIRIYLPRYSIESVEALDEPAPAIPAATASEAILVVEDDDDVRANSVDSLRELGYGVIEASDGAAALRILEAQPSSGCCLRMLGCPAA